MNILFMGSAAFAIPSLLALLDSKHKVVEVVTQPDKPAGRGYTVRACPVAEIAQEKRLRLYQPTRLRESEVIEHLASRDADLFVVVAYGKILPRAVLDLPSKGCVNVHASLLPKYRGAAPIQWAIARGETKTGVTTMYLAEEMDAGDILLSCTTDIDPCETAGLLHDRLAPLGAELLLKTIDAIAKGEAKPKPQHHESATYAPVIAKEDGHLDWNNSAPALFNRIRGFTPWPGAFALLNGKRLLIHEAASVERLAEVAPGTIIDNNGNIAVATADGVLYLLEVQLEGKTRMSAQEFLRGHRLEKGTKLT